MRDRYLESVEARLSDRGIKPDVVADIAAEMGDHFDDLVAELVADGRPESVAEREACKRLGMADAIAASATEYRQLLCWSRRYPGAALVVYPLACAAVLPAVPVLMGVRHAPVVGRWLSCLLAGGIVTTTIFLLLTNVYGL